MVEHASLNIDSSKMGINSDALTTVECAWLLCTSFLDWFAS